MVTVQDRIARRLRRDIVRGRLKPGARLPNRVALAASFHAGPVTIQGAVSRLVEEGFLTVGARKKGTFVAARPPHLFHYKLIFPFNSLKGQFFRVLHDEAERVTNTSDQTFSFFFGMGGHQDIPVYEDLVEQVRSERLAGLVFASNASEFADTPLLDQTGVPRAAIGCPTDLPGVPKVQIDYASFIDRALDYLLACGRRHVAFLGPGGKPMTEAFCQGMAARGLEVRPVWLQYADIWSPVAARHVVHLLLHKEQTRRPDGLVIGDDNFLESATYGITDADVRVPEELSVAALANFPAAIPTAVPVMRFGFDHTAMLAALVNAIDMQRQGKRPCAYSALAAISENDYKS